MSGDKAAQIQAHLSVSSPKTPYKVVFFVSPKLITVIYNIVLSSSIPFLPMMNGAIDPPPSPSHPVFGPNLCPPFQMVPLLVNLWSSPHLPRLSYLTLSSIFFVFLSVWQGSWVWLYLWSWASRLLSYACHSQSNEHDWSFRWLCYKCSRLLSTTYGHFVLCLHTSFITVSIVYFYISVPNKTEVKVLGQNPGNMGAVGIWPILISC